jgi:hypothetical protein
MDQSAWDPAPQPRSIANRCAPVGRGSPQGPGLCVLPRNYLVGRTSWLERATIDIAISLWRERGFAERRAWGFSFFSPRVVFSRHAPSAIMLEKG